MSIEAMKIALEALEHVITPHGGIRAHVRDSKEARHVAYAWTSLRQAIAEAEGISLMPIKHPVGPKWDGDINPDSLEEIEIDLPKREWVGLTDEEINDVLPGHRVIDALDI